MKRRKIKEFFKTLFQFFVNPRFLLCFGIAWIITNGWSYIMLVIGTYFGIDWMIAVAGGYLAILWLPISPEKIITVLIAMWLLKVIFPNDKKTLGVLKNLYEKYKIKKTKKEDIIEENESVNDKEVD